MSSNEKLQAVYQEMHQQGPSAWFSDGNEERQTIVRVGSPWDGLRVLEIGCGEGELSAELSRKGADITAVDYSEVAVNKAHSRFLEIKNSPWFVWGDYKNLALWGHDFDRIVMQGVLEHLDHPWQELTWIADNLLTPAGDIITSSPCFLNPRGIVWMTLATLFDAPMSLTDLHFLHPWQFEEFAEQHGLKITTEFCDWDWGNGQACVRDLSQRLPKVFPDIDSTKITRLLDWLSRAKSSMAGEGATAVYHLARRT